MFSVVQLLGSLIVFVALIAALGAGWHHIGWIRMGRPQFTGDEELSIDVLRAQGHSLNSARRMILERRNSPFALTIVELREAGDLISNPDREAELREIL